MKKSARVFVRVLGAVLCVFVTCALAEQPAVRTFPAPGAWEFTFKPGVSSISYFLKGNVHDTLGTVTKMQGSATASITREGRFSQAAVQFSFAADTMDSKDAARDERMKKKFMEIRLYPEVAYRSISAGSGLQQSMPVAQATRDAPIAFDLEGILKIHGVEKLLTIPVTAYPENGLLVVRGDTILLLRDFNIANPSFFIFRTEEYVRIHFLIALQPVAGATL